MGLFSGKAGWLPFSADRIPLSEFASNHYLRALLLIDNSFSLREKARMRGYKMRGYKINTLSLFDSLTLPSPGGRGVK